MPPKKGKVGSVQDGANPYKMGPPRGDQRFELPNKLKEKRGGGDEWRQWSRSKLAIKMTKAANQDYYDRAFLPGEAGKEDLHNLLTTLHLANPAMEDISQPTDNPVLIEDEKKLAAEIKRYREIAASRRSSEVNAAASKPRMNLRLRLLSGEVHRSSSAIVASNYEELQQAFVDCFPWHQGVVVIEYPDGRAVHPQTASFREGDLVCFREMSPPDSNLVTDHLQTLPAGWVRMKYRPTLLALSTTLIADGVNTKHRPGDEFSDGDSSVGGGGSVTSVNYR
jgi:hypothetical protein